MRCASNGGSGRRSPVNNWARTVAAAALALTVSTIAQDPSIGLPVRIDIAGGVKAANEPSVSVSETDPGQIVAAFNDWRESTGNTERIRLGVAVSLDGGATWSDFLLRPPTINQSLIEGDAMTAYDDRTGAMWAGAISFTENGGIFVARKEPGSGSFNPAVMAHVSPDADKCWMAAGPRPNEPDSTRLYVTFNEGVIWSDDMGDTWTVPKPLEGSGAGFLPRVGPNGELYIAYWDGGAEMRLHRSFDGGASFTLPKVIAVRMDIWGNASFNPRFPGTFRVAPFVYFDVDHNNGTLYAVYFDTTAVIEGNYNIDLYFCKSVDQGETWTTPVVINADNDPPGDQFFPWLEVDGQGRIHIVYLDSRNTVQDDSASLDNVHGMFDAYYMVSDDGGDSFQEFRLTPKPWDSEDDGLDRVAQFIGDYLGLSVAGNRVYPVYLSTANGDADIYTNVITFPNDADLDGDGSVGVTDLLILLGSWGPCDDCNNCPADLDGDCSVGVADLLILLGNWG
ncbi:MAG: hypothetical protein IIB53_15010 [Planctomycetes bacterium]|nr:hypothetical protein [Planctomycetota bacterium]